MKLSGFSQVEWRKSSRSTSTEGSNCVEVAALPALGWRKSARSAAGEGSDCVEVAGVDRMVVARDSKDPDGAVLSFSAAEWSSFMATVRRM